MQLRSETPQLNPDETAYDRVKKVLKVLALLVAVFILCCGVFIAWGLYANWSAERRARAFCDAIPVGSSISGAITRANLEKLHWGSEKFYRFYFPGAFFDKAVCDAEVDNAGRVLRKASEIQYD